MQLPLPALSRPHVEAHIEGDEAGGCRGDGKQYEGDPAQWRHTQADTGTTYFFVYTSQRSSPWAGRGTGRGGLEGGVVER